jgi:hypothetical protein
VGYPDRVGTCVDGIIFLFVGGLVFGLKGTQPGTVGELVSDPVRISCFYGCVCIPYVDAGIR